MRARSDVETGGRRRVAIGSVCPAPAACRLSRGSLRSVLLCAALVVSSWLVAVTVLVVTLRFLPVSAGYVPDHME
jgi:predicted secreted protein